MKRKLSLLVTVILVFAMALSACTKTDTSGKGSDAELRVGIVQDPGAIKYDNSTDYTNVIMHQVYQSLFRLNSKGEYINELCTEYALDDDGMGVTFKLQKGVKFNDGSGNEMKASDVIFSVKMALQGATASGIPFIDPDGMTAPDDYTVHLKFKNQFGPWQNGFTNLFIMSEAAYSASDDTAFWLDPVSTGPYSVAENGWVSGSTITLERFDDYWRGPCYFKTITFKVMAEQSVAAMELEAGTVDILIQPTYEEVKGIRESGNTDIAIDEYIGNTGHYIGMNHTKPLFQDIRIRQAIAYATDREALVQGALNGAGTVNDGTLGPGNVGYTGTYAGDKWPYKYDPEKAKALLAEAGYPNGLELHLVVDGTPIRVALGEQLQNMWSQVGINLVLDLYDFATATDVLNNQTDWDLYLRGAGYNNGEVYMLFLVPVYNLNRVGEATPGYTEYKALLDKIGATTDVAERTKLYGELNDRFVSEWLFWLPTITPNAYVMRDAKLVNFERLGSRFWFEKAYFEN